MSSNVGKIALVAAVAIAAPYALGAMGGTAITTGTAVNAAGQAVGTSMVSGGAQAASGFLGTGFSGGQLLGFAGKGMSALGSIQQGRAAEAQANYNARLQEYNSQIAKQDAVLARASAQDKANRTQDETRRRVGAMRSAYTKAGVLTSEGSPLLVQQEQQVEGNLEARRQLYQGTLDSMRFGQQSDQALMQSSALRMEGRSARKSGYQQAATTILTGGSRILS